MNELIKELGTVKQKIRRLESRSLAITHELQKLKAREKELESMIKPSELAGLGRTTTDEILILISTTKHTFLPSEVLASLEANGIKFNHVKDPYTYVYNLCKRLSKQEKLNTVIKDGKKAFVRK